MAMKTPKKPDWLILEDGEEYVRPLYIKPTIALFAICFLGVIHIQLAYSHFTGINSVPQSPSNTDALKNAVFPPTSGSIVLDAAVWLLTLLLIAILLLIARVSIFPYKFLTTRRNIPHRHLNWLGSREFRLSALTRIEPVHWPNFTCIFEWIDGFYIDEAGKQKHISWSYRRHVEVARLIKELAAAEKERLGDHIGASMLLGREDFLYEPREAANGQK